MMKSTDSLITKFISYFSNVFNEKFFIATEKLLLDLTSLTIPTATIIGFFISLVIAIKTDSLTNFGAGFAWILLVVIFHFIGGRFLNNNLLMIKNNPNTISNKDILDVYSISLIALRASSGAIAAKSSESSSSTFLILISVRVYCGLFPDPRSRSNSVS